MNRSMVAPPLLLLCSTILVVFSLRGSLCSQTIYDYTIFEYPGAGLTHPYAINDAGVVAGSYEYGNHGFIRDADGGFSTVDFPGGSKNLLRAINDDGIVAGQYKLSGIDHGFTYSQGTWTTLPTPPGANPNFGAHGINDAGIIVGSYVAASAADHGFLYDGVQYTTIDYPAAMHTILTGIDDQGLIIGNYWIAGSGRWRGFLYDGADYLPLEKPGAYWTWLSGLNNLGEIVGQEVDASGMIRTAIHYDGEGTWTSLNIPGATGWTAAQDINDLGQICGYLYDETFTSEQGFIAVPASPEIDFIRGDGNGDGFVELSDVIYLLSYLFTFGPSLCLDSHDVDDDGVVDLADVINLLGYLFQSDAPPLPPFPACGQDPTADDISCESFPACP